MTYLSSRGSFAPALMDVSLQFRVVSPGAAPSFLGLANRRLLSASVCWPHRPSAPTTRNTMNPCPTCPRIKTPIITASKSEAMSAVSLQLSRRGSHRHLPPLGLPALVLSPLSAGSRLRSIVSSAVEPRITTIHPTSGTNSSNTDTNSIPGGTRVGVTLGAFGQRVTASPGERSSGCSSFPQEGDITSPVSLPTEGTVDKFSTIASVDWTDWMLSGSSSSSDNADMTMSMSAPFDDRDDGSGASDSAAASTMPAAETVASLQPVGLSSSVVVTTIRISFYAVAASFDRRQLESRLRTAYGNQSVRKYPDVIHCPLSRSREAQPGACLLLQLSPTLSAPDRPCPLLLPALYFSLTPESPVHSSGAIPSLCLKTSHDIFGCFPPHVLYGCSMGICVGLKSTQSKLLWHSPMKGTHRYCTCRTRTWHTRGIDVWHVSVP